jgi:hypothetical protein
MGVYGNVLIYPELALPEGGWLSRAFGRRLIPEAFRAVPPVEQVMAVARVFEAARLLQPGALLTAEPSAKPLADNSHVATYRPPSDEYAHLQFAPNQLTGALAALVFTATDSELNSDDSAVSSSAELVVPWLDITVVSSVTSVEVEPHPQSKHLLRQVQSWAFVEFAFGDVRFSDEVHVIRNPSHQIFEDLKAYFHSPVQWARLGY